ncbi:hypothetical protein GPECTOR_59g644 [Gonium pectorale]|uniref:Uncharacterized protein n=1 Tax=Gonium pectorale TaxID=33097 RepID=A0A150G574_GONPE|nr:hypothetical protein GPECTOR_59g644 [Gonium pectorale]|eukprot:KXZ45036.1 hypothetical protein GPECTOR_59g644 [Gonium pectorale]
MLLRGDITLEDEAYRGRRTSRAAIFGEDGDADDVDDDEDDDEGSDLDLDLDLSGGGDDGDGGNSDDADEDEEEEHDARGRRRRAADAAGPSGRAEGAAAGRRAAAAGTKLANGRASASAGAGGRDGSGLGSDDEELGSLGSSDGGDTSGDEEDGFGGEDGLLDGDDGEDDEEEEEPRAAKRQRAAAAETATANDPALAALEAEYEALAAEDEQQLTALREKGERDRVKGVAVRNQQILYERALEQRIRLQRCLQASNGLPRPATHAVLRAAAPEVAQGLSQLASAARETLSQLLELQRTLMARNPGIAMPPQPTKPPRSSKPSKQQPADRDDGEGPSGRGDGNDGGSEATDALWARLSAQTAALGPFRDASLDSWHRRTVLSSGSGALRNSGLRALNQSVSSQVAALMRDPAKFIKRTRLTLSACPRVLCEPPRASAAAAAADALTAEAAEADAAGATSASVAADAAGLEEEDRDPETYDDSEFYQQLLKEFLDKGLTGATAAAPKAAKKRKQVDRRASKGRKLRYQVQDKLVAFMAPVDLQPPPFAANLFSNLFGHAGN